MGSRGRMPPPPPPHMRHPLSGPGMGHPDAFSPRMRPGAFPPFDMPPHPEILEQKLSAQHNEMQKLLNENQRLARTHGTLRQELAAAQHELQMLHSQIGAVKSEREHQIRGLMDKIARVESDLKASEPLKSELDKARAEAQGMVVARQELINKAKKLEHDIKRAHADAQILPALLNELEGVRQEFHHCRATYEYEKKLYSDHLESLQAMEKNYANMFNEVEKLQTELNNTASAERRTGGPYGGTEISGQYTSGQKPAEDNHGVPQGQNIHSVGSSIVVSAGAPTAQAGTQQVHMAPKAGYPSFDPQTGHYYDPHRPYAYGAPPLQPGFDPQRAAANYGYEAQWAAGNPLGQVVPPANAAYPSAMAPNRAGTGYDMAATRGQNPVHR